MYKLFFEKFLQQFIKTFGRKPQTTKEWMSIQDDVVRYINKTKGVPEGSPKPPFQGFKPTVIEGGKSKKGIDTLFKDSPERIAKMKADNKAAIERLKKKKKTVEDFSDDGDFDPGGMASGGLAREGYFKGKIIKGIASLGKKKKPTGKIWKSSEGETQGIAMGFSEEELKGLDRAMAKGTALSDAMKKMNLNPGSTKDYDKFNKLVSEGMIGFPNELKEQIIRAKYGDVVDQKLLNQMLADNNPQRISEVMGTIDEGLIMQEKGMHPDEIVETIKTSLKRTPNASGGRASLSNGGLAHILGV